MDKKRTPLIFCSCLIAASLLACASLAIFGDAGFAFAKNVTLTSCADITFGSEKYIDSNEFSGTSDFTSKNINVSSVESSKCYVEAGKALRMGSSKANGSFTLNFSSSVALSSLRVLAYLYSNDTASLTIYEDDTFQPSQEVKATSGDQIDNCLASDWLCYTGFDGEVSSLTFTSTNRICLCKVVFVITDAPSYSVDYSSYSDESSSWTSESSAYSHSEDEGTYDSNHSYPLSETDQYYSSYMNGTFVNHVDLSPADATRIEPVVSSNGKSVACYARKDSGNHYAVETIYKGGMYTDPNEVACYINAFNECPANYCLYTNTSYSGSFPDGTLSDTAAKKYIYENYGTKGRLYTYYDRTNGYAASVPVKTTDSDFYYWEVDFDVTGEYSASSSFNRGADRLIVFPKGVTTSGYKAGQNFIVRTLDHYQHAREFSNYLDGWGENFDMNCTKGDYGSYSFLTTESLSI